MSKLFLLLPCCETWHNRISSGAGKWNKQWEGSQLSFFPRFSSPYESSWLSERNFHCFTRTAWRRKINSHALIASITAESHAISMKAIHDGFSPTSQCLRKKASKVARSKQPRRIVIFVSAAQFISRSLKLWFSIRQRRMSTHKDKH